jgi:HSP20 family protein
MADRAAIQSEESKATGKNKQQSSKQENLAPAPAPNVFGWTSPFGLMRVFMDDLDRLVGGFALPGTDPNTSSSLNAAPSTGTPWVPPIEVFERDGKFVIRADVPGTDREQIDVEVDDDRVVLSGERVDEREENTSSFYRRERTYGRFQRAIPLPDGVDASQATATFNNGVLEIGMPITDRPGTRKLEIQQGAGDTSAKTEGSQSASSSKPEAQTH